MSSAAASSAAATATPAPVDISFFADSSALLAGDALRSSKVQAARGVLVSDPTVRVLTRVRENGREYVFARLPLSELQGRTAFDVWLVGKGKFHCFSCLPHGAGNALLRLNLESYGAFPEEGAPPDKLINVISNKLWPTYLTS